MFLIKVFDKNEINLILREESVNSYLLYYKIKHEGIALVEKNYILYDVAGINGKSLHKYILYNSTTVYC